MSSLILLLLSNIKSLLFAMILIILYNIYSRRRTSLCMSKLPSTKLKFWHVLGHVNVSIDRILRRTSNGHTWDVYEFERQTGYATLFRDAGIFSAWHGSKPFVAVYIADTVKVILGHSTELRKSWFYTFSANWIGTGLLTSEGKKWKQRRKLLTPTFHFDILKDFICGINKQSQILVNLLKSETDKQWINVVPYITRCSLDIICETTLGAEVNSQTAAESKYVQAILELSEAMVIRIHSPWYWPDKLFKLSKFGKRYFNNIETVHNFTKEVITKRKLEIQEKVGDIKNGDKEENKFRYSNRKALLEFLIQEHLNFGTISEEGIREEIDTFTFEGHDTTSMGMSWVIYLIGLYSEVQEKLQEELNAIFGENRERPIDADDLSNMKYLERIIKETLRLYPSVPFIARELIDDVEIMGYTVPKGATCAIDIYSLHRDRKVYPNPEVFDPDRFLPENSEERDTFAYVPFSVGHRNCIGQRFAMMEEKIVLATIFRNFNVQSIDHRDKVQVVNNIVLRPENGIRIKIRNKNI